MPEKTDLELINEFKEGKIEGFNELVRRYQKRIYWVARRIVGSHDDADDVVQDVFVKVYHKLNDFRGDSEFYTWLYRVAINTSYNSINKRKIKELFDFTEVEDTKSDSSSADTLVLEEEYQSLLDNAIASLPSKQKAVFQMRYFEEMPYHEIAKILKRSEGGVKANFFHAMNKIKEFMQKEYAI